MLNLKNKPSQNMDFQCQELDDELLLHSVKNTKTIFLNTSSYLIWSLCDGKKTVSQIVDNIASQFPENKDQILSDVIDAISKLADDQAITLA